jgi:hypothetical protein
MKYSHYYKTLPCLTVDVYRVLHAFDVTDPCLQHAAKKIMVAGGRGAKDAKKDVEEAIDSLVRWLEMRREESGENMQGNNLSVSICDSMNLADSFLKDIRASELAYAENQHKTLWTEADEERMRVVVHNGNDGEVYKQDGGWIQNKAGVQPVPNKCKVDVRFPVGVVEDVFAGSLYWRPCGGDAYIVAYRIRNEIYNDDEEAHV